MRNSLQTPDKRLSAAFRRVGSSLTCHSIVFQSSPSETRALLNNTMSQARRDDRLVSVYKNQPRIVTTRNAKCLLNQSLFVATTRKSVSQVSL